MGFTLTAFVDGDAMSAATMTTNVETIRNWLNGGIATGDIVNGSVSSRHIRKLEHYLQGTANPRSDGVSGTTTRRAYTGDPKERVYVCKDAHGIGWEDVSTCAHRFYVRDTGLCEVVFGIWAWAIQSNQTNPEALNTCDFRLKLNGTAIDATRVTLFDAGYDNSANDGGPYTYAARNLGFIFQRSLSAGWNNVKLQVLVADQGSATTDVPEYALIIIGARNLHAETWIR